MPFKDYQKQVDEWTSQFAPQYWNVEWQLSQLQEESGELAREVNHYHGPKKKKESESDSTIGKELVDVIFPLICMANNLNIDLDKEWELMMQERLRKRDANRFEKKD
ncbi:nucleotide pyrophosphohydrolase [Candidatus Pacearchaeota archaeon]|nr:nucleotide pyrophosphohydrolase [Candidatus Pacearchaeota archaeon]